MKLNGWQKLIRPDGFLSKRRTDNVEQISAAHSPIILVGALRQKFNFGTLPGLIRGSIKIKPNNSVQIEIRLLTHF